MSQILIWNKDGKCYEKMSHLTIGQTSTGLVCDFGFWSPLHSDLCLIQRNAFQIPTVHTNAKHWRKRLCVFCAVVLILWKSQLTFETWKWVSSFIGNHFLIKFGTFHLLIMSQSIHRVSTFFIILLHWLITRWHFQISVEKKRREEMESCAPGWMS